MYVLHDFQDKMIPVEWSEKGASYEKSNGEYSGIGSNQGRTRPDDYDGTVDKNGGFLSRRRLIKDIG